MTTMLYDHPMQPAAREALLAALPSAGSARHLTLPAPEGWTFTGQRDGPCTWLVWATGPGLPPIGRVVAVVCPLPEQRGTA